MLSKTERQQVKQLLQSPQWSSIQLLAQKLDEKWKDESNVRETEWETLRALLENEGRRRGLSLFIQELFNQAQNNE